MSHIYLIILSAGILSSYYIISPETGFILSLAFVFLWFIGIKKLYFNGKVIQELWPIFLLIIVGIGSGLGEENNTTQIFRDGFYISNFIVALLFGYALFESLHFNLNKLYFVLLLASILVSVFTLYRLVNNFNVFSEALYSVRNTIGRGNVLNSIGFSLPILLIKKGYKYKKSLILCSILSLLSLSATLSRVWVFTSICIIAFYLLVGKKRKNILKYFIIGFLSYSLIAPIIKPIILPYISHNSVMGRFVEKILSPYEEFTQTDYHSRGDISQHWRGYELKIVLNKITNSSFLQILFGSGFGTFVDTGFYYEIEGTLYRFKGVFHNGFLFLLLKSGITGIILYCYFLIRKMRAVYNKIKITVALSSDLYMEPMLLTGLVCGFLFTIFNAGFINPTAFVPVGMLLGSWLIKEYT